MKRQPNRYVFGFALAIFLGLLSLVLFAFYSRWLPHPEQASRNQLLYWVATRDLDQESLEIRQALLERLIAEYDNDEQLARLRSDLVPTAYREQITANIKVLKREWFALQVARYSSDSDARWELVEAGFLQAQRFVEAASRVSEGEGKELDIAAEVAKLIAELPESERPVAKNLVGDAVVFWLTQADVSKWTNDQRLALAREIAKSLDAKPLEALPSDQVWSNEEQERLKANVMSLLTTWAQDQALVLAAISGSQEREAWVDQRIDQVLRWKILEALTDKTQSPSTWQSQFVSLQQLRKITARWIEQAPETEKQAMQEMVDLVMQRIGTRLMQSWFVQ